MGSTTLSKKELINLVKRIIQVDGSEEEINEMINVLKKNVPHPSVTDLIFYSEDDMTAEEIIEKALSHPSIPLS